MFVCLFVHLVSFITVLFDLFVYSFVLFVHIFLSTSLLRQNPILLILAAINLMFLVVSMVSSYALFLLIFGFFLFCVLLFFFILDFLLFFQLQNIQII